MDAYFQDAELTTEDGRQDRTRGPPATPALPGLAGLPVANRNGVDGRQPFMDVSVVDVRGALADLSAPRAGRT